jgi:thioredoxin-like negative regulator of GroEL
LIERGRFDEAVPQLEGILAANPAHAAARVELARVRVARNELDSAKVIIQPALTNAYTARPATLLVAQIMQREGKSDEAAQLSARAATMPRPFDWPDPFLREVHSLRTDRQRLADQVNGLIQKQRTQEAEALISKLLNTFPDDTEGLLLLGRLRYVEKKCPEAEQALRRHQFRTLRQSDISRYGIGTGQSDSGGRLS